MICAAARHLLRSLCTESWAQYRLRTKVLTKDLLLMQDSSFFWDEGDSDGETVRVAVQGSARASEAAAYRTARKLNDTIEGEVLGDFARLRGIEIVSHALEFHTRDPVVLQSGWQLVHCLLWQAGRCGRAKESCGREENVKQLIAHALMCLSVHVAIAPLVWICLSSLCLLLDLDAPTTKASLTSARVSQTLVRVMRDSMRHAQVLEQACRLIALMLSERAGQESFGLASTFRSDGITEAVRKAAYLHGKHKGVQALTSWALRVLEGGGQRLPAQVSAQKLEDVAHQEDGGREGGV